MGSEGTTRRVRTGVLVAAAAVILGLASMTAAREEGLAKTGPDYTKLYLRGDGNAQDSS